MTLAPAVVIGFPTTARAHVVALSVSGDVAELRRLAQRCAAAGRRAGLEMERRRFRPHVTLARASSRSAPVDARRVVASYDGPPWPVTTLRLVHSTIGAVVTHRTLATWPVGAEGADQLTSARRPSRRSG
jgi:2'-5' RNA ligase